MYQRIIKKALKTINDNTLIDNGDRILVAFSGGADSVCLLYILCLLREKLGIQVYAAHVNHNLRGEAANNDERFAIEFSKSLGVKCFVFNENVKEYAKKHSISEELAGREIRYARFLELMHQENFNKLAIGHHADDRAETVIMNMLRGSGIEGLCGIRYKRDNIIRPLLNITKKEILDFCKINKLDFCTDLTNFETEYTRNKVRIDLIPKMTEFNENLVVSLSNTADILADESDFLQEASHSMFLKIVKNNTVSIQDIKKCHPAIIRRVIRKMIESVKDTKKDISFEYVSSVMDLLNSGKTGKSIDLCKGIKAYISYGQLTISRCEDFCEVCIDVNLGTRALCKFGGVNLENLKGGDFNFPQNACFCLRTRIPGDRIYPIGMSGSKKLKDIFIDEKVPREERAKALVLTCNSEVAAVKYMNTTLFDRRFYKKGNGSVNVIFFDEVLSGSDNAED